MHKYFPILFQIILVTDCSTGIGPTSLQHGLQEYTKSEQWNTDADRSFSLLKSSDFPLPFRFNGRLHVACVANPNEPSTQSALPLFQRLIDINDNGGELYVPDAALSFKSVESMFQRLGEQFYHPFMGTLKCGHLQSTVQLFPPPEPYKK